MDGEPFLPITVLGAEVTFTLGADDDPATVENADAVVIMPDGSRRSATFLTVAEVARILDRWSVSGEGRSGGYLRVPDLVVTREPGVPAMVAALEDLIGDPGEASLTRLAGA